MKYLGYVEDPDLWELDVLKGGEDDLFPVVVELYRVLAVGRDHHHHALVLAVEPHHQVAQQPRLRPSFLLFISSMLASFSVIRELSFRSNVPTLIPTYNTCNQSLVTNSKFIA